MSDVKELAKIIRQAEGRYFSLRNDRIINCKPNVNGWNKAEWERDFPSPGNQDEFIAQAILDAGYSR